ncbi:hypothetical protein F5Y10DRAFT_261725 [Nemania abortiva]|nr:hypothetical protein F5Y10DRAFT_261725 [Nemania abortiva]
MAQKGGTYHPEAIAEASVPAQSTPAPEPQDGDGGQKDKQDPAIGGHPDEALTEASPNTRHQLDTQSDEQWTAVPRPEAGDGDNPPGREYSCHFDCRLGWGRWKFTLFTWDMYIRKNAR